MKTNSMDYKLSAQAEPETQYATPHLIRGQLTERMLTVYRDEQLLSKLIDIKIGPSGFSIIQPVDHLLQCIFRRFTSAWRSFTST
jgi:hypothetical protein